MSRRAARVVIAAGAWTAFIWAFRMWNMVGEGHSAGFLVVHGLIAGVSVAFAVALVVIGARAIGARRSPVGGEPLARSGGR